MAYPVYHTFSSVACGIILPLYKGLLKKLKFT